MAKVSRLFLVAAIGLSLVPFMAGTAGACSCQSVTDRAMAKKSDVVFAGFVTGGEYPDGADTVDDTLDEIRWTFLPDTLVKGVDEGPVEVTSESQSAACGIDFKVGQRYLVFAYDDEGALTTNSCNRTRSYYDEVELAGAEKVKGVYGEASGPGEGNSWLGFQREDGSWSVGRLVATLGALAVVIGIGAVLVRRRRVTNEP